MTTYNATLRDIDTGEEHEFEVEADSDRYALAEVMRQAIEIEGEQAFEVVHVTALPDPAAPVTTEPPAPLDPLVEEPEELPAALPIIEPTPEPEGVTE